VRLWRTAFAPRDTPQARTRRTTFIRRKAPHRV